MSARGLTAALKTEFLKKKLAPIVLVEIQFVSGTERLWSGIGNLSWASQTWKGVGDLGGISSITESADVAANGLQLSLSGIPVELLDEALNEVRPGNRVKVWLGAINPSGQVIVDPYLSFHGYTDVPTVEDSGETCTISLACEPRWIDRRARVWRYTQEDQNILSPGDTGFRFLKDINKPLYWGKAGVNVNRSIMDVKYGGDRGGRLGHYGSDM